MITTNYSLKQNNSRNTHFGNAFNIATQSLNYINNSPAVGATIVDVGSMALPRTIVDSKRGANAGIETGIRETSGSVNHAMVGAYGLLGTLIAANILNSKYGVKIHNVNADMQSVNVYSDMWQDFLSKTPKQTSDNKALRTNYFNYVLKNTFGFNNDAYSTNYWRKVSDDTVNKATEIVSKALEKGSKNDYKLPKEDSKKILSLLTANLGTQQDIKVKFKEKEIHTTVESLVNDVFALGKTFTSEKIKPLYTNNDSKGITKFLKRFGRYKAVSTAIGLGIGCAIGASVQPLNRYLTKKRTGQDGFVGVDTHKKSEKSGLFKLYKGLAVGAMGLLTYTALGKSPSSLVRRVQFKGLMPSLDQFKLVYGVTIMSRFLAARDTNELRESTFKDFLGYTNWLILGGFVSKLVANKINPKLITLKNPEKSNKSFIEWMKNSSLKSQSEILLSEAKKAKVDILKDGKLKSFKELLSETVKKSPNVKAKIRGINIAQLAGLAYSGIVLGWAIPKINILVTKKINENPHKAKTIEELHAERIKMH